MTALLEVKGLRTVFHLLGGAWSAVDGIDLNIARGEVLCLVGESGSGKSVTGFSLVQLIDPPGKLLKAKSCSTGKICVRHRMSGCVICAVTVLR